MSGRGFFARPRAVIGGALLALLAGVAGAGCGGGGEGSTTVEAPASKLADRVLLSGMNPTVTATDLAGPIAAYKRHVAAELGTMEGDLRRLQTAVDAGDLEAARRAWLAADSSYESIGAAYGAFGDLDARINGETAGLPGGASSPDFTGLHRIELALFGRGSVADAASYVPRLAADVRRSAPPGAGPRDRTARIRAARPRGLRGCPRPPAERPRRVPGAATRWSPSTRTCAARGS